MPSADDAILGEDVLIRVTVEEHALMRVGAVVTHDVQQGATIVGVPAGV